MVTTSYVIALGANRPSRNGAPEAALAATLAELGGAASPIIRTAPIGPSIRRYANAACVITSPLPPPALLAVLKRMERAAGRRPGRRWGSRPLDLDIILWSGGAWSSPGLTIPHPAFRERGFVLEPLAAIAPDWRDPITGLTVRQLHARLTRRRPAYRAAASGGS